MRIEGGTAKGHHGGHRRACKGSAELGLTSVLGSTRGEGRGVAVDRRPTHERTPRTKGIAEARKDSAEEGLTSVLGSTIERRGEGVDFIHINLHSP
jgi:hypothetical protein